MTKRRREIDERERKKKEGKQKKREGGKKEGKKATSITQRQTHEKFKIMACLFSKTY